MTLKFCVIPGDCYVKAIGQRNIGGEHKTDTACPWADTGTDRSQIASTYSLIEMGRGNIFVNDLVGLRQVFNVSYEEFFKDIPPSRSSKQTPDK